MYYGYVYDDEYVWLTGCGKLLYDEFAAGGYSNWQEYFRRSDSDLSNIELSVIEVVARSAFSAEIAQIEALTGKPLDGVVLIPGISGNPDALKAIAAIQQGMNKQKKG